MISVSPDMLESLIISQLTKFKNEEKPWSADVYEFSDKKVEDIAKGIRKILEGIDTDRNKEEIENGTQEYFNKQFEDELEESRARSMIMMEQDVFIERHMEQAHRILDEEE